MQAVEPISFPDAPRVEIGGGRDDVSALTAAMVETDHVPTLGKFATVTEWQPTADELAQLNAGARVRLWVYQCGQPLQPLALDVSAVPTIP